MSSIIEKATDAVADVAASLGATTIADKIASTTPNNDAVLASAAEGRRLYIGNLAYATTEEELTNFFKGYLVESTSIPKNPRTDRPVGYAFVDLSTPVEAERAINELSGKEILERKVSVQLARKPEPSVPAAERAESGDNNGEGNRRRGTSGRGRGRGRGRGGRAGRNGTRDNADQPADSEVLPLQDVTGSVNNKTEETAQESKEAKAPRQPRERREPREAQEPRERRERGPPADGVPSKNKVMVANLPYDLTEEKLKELFAAYEPISAKIALRPIPRFMVKKLQARNEPRKGRGFGFVTLASEEQQKKACEEMNAKIIEEREIAVKVAIDSPDKIDDDNNVTATTGAATATNGASEQTITA